MAEDWLRCKGFRPRLLRFLRRFHWRWVDTYILDRSSQQFEDERTRAVLTAVWQTGKTVTAAVDEEGNFVMEIHED
jgi:hypothetical protein